MHARSAPGLFVLMASAASAISFSEGVCLKCELDSTVAFELRQYWLLDDGATRSTIWAEEHLARTVEGEPLPGEDEVIGELDFAAERAHAISIDLERCGSTR